MNANIQYSRTPEPNQAVDEQLFVDMWRQHSTIPAQLRQAYVHAMINASDWLLGNMDFDQFVDKLGAIADHLKETDEARQIISNN